MTGPTQSGRSAAETRGAAYAQGALFSLRGEGQATEEVFNELCTTLKSLEYGTLDELRRIRESVEEQEPPDSSTG